MDSFIAWFLGVLWYGRTVRVDGQERMTGFDYENFQERRPGRVVVSRPDESTVETIFHLDAEKAGRPEFVRLFEAGSAEWLQETYYRYLVSPTIGPTATFVAVAEVTTQMGSKSTRTTYSYGCISLSRGVTLKFWEESYGRNRDCERGTNRAVRAIFSSPKQLIRRSARPTSRQGAATAQFGLV